MRKLLACAIAGTLAAGSIIAAPLAAQAAPSSFQLPKSCDVKTITVKDLKQLAVEGFDSYDVKRADVHTSKGKEYVFSTLCSITEDSVSEVLVVANSKGKIIKSKIFKNTAVDVRSASKATGVRLYVDKVYSKSAKVSVGYSAEATYKWNKKSKKFVYKVAATPSWVKAVNNAVVAAEKGKKVTSLKSASTLTKRVQALDSKLPLLVLCDIYKSSKTSCTVMSTERLPDFQYFDFNFKKSGKTFKVTKTGKVKLEKA